MRNPLQTKEWTEEIIHAVLEWDKNHKEVMRMQSFDTVENKRNITESKQKIVRRLRRIVLSVARAHLRHESVVKPNDLKALFSILEKQNKEIHHLSDTLKGSKDSPYHIRIV